MDHQKPSAALFDVYLRLRLSSALDKERFLDVEETEAHEPTHITIKPPTNDTRKRAIERFAFTRVFEEHSGQRELFESTGILPLVEGVLGAPGREGRDGLVATLGVTGSGKSHTILGSKSQRGITQLTLDVLFQQTAPHLVEVDTSPTVFSSLCAADYSEAHLIPASNLLDSIYHGDGPSVSRAATPALVRESALPSYIHPTTLPGTYPSSLRESVMSQDTPSKPPKAAVVVDRLYPSLSKYNSPPQAQAQPPLPRSSISSSKSTIKPISKFAHVTRSFASRLANLPFTQETSFLSAPSSRKYMPRVSALPQFPPTDDISLEIDDSAEYAIVISMYEVYNDRIFDLLTASASSNKAQQKRRALLFKSTEHSPDRKVVAGLRKVVCSNLEEALLVLETGLTERRVAGTGSNAVSSRSHGFFCLDIKKRHRGTHHPGPWTSSTLTIVDLAGSERARTAKTAGATLAEAGKINESLMYLGQCMQMQSDNAQQGGEREKLVPFRQCKLTELLFSNSFAAHGPAHVKAPQKAVMIVTADPLGDFNATSQILRYSALAREVTVPRIPSVTSTILCSGPNNTGKTNGAGYFSGRSTPSAIQEELEHALAAIAQLRSDLEVTQMLLAEETQRRQEAERSWKFAENRIEEVEAEIREEVFSEMESKLAQEQRRWRAARDAELDAQDEHLDRKLELLANGISIYEDETAEKENSSPDNDHFQDGKISRQADAADVERMAELEHENMLLREKMANMERQKEVMRSPSKKMKVLKTPSRKWEGSGVGLME